MISNPFHILNEAFNLLYVETICDRFDDIGDIAKLLTNF